MSFSDSQDKLQYPSKMSDGRQFTDYRPRCNVNADLLDNLAKNNLINSSYESRLYLQQNADVIIQNERAKAIQRLSPCNPSKSTILPERYVVKCDAISCTRTEVNPYGLGDGRNY